MKLIYRQTTAKHEIFRVEFRGSADSYDFEPRVIAAGVLFKPLAIQVPLALPGGITINGHTLDAGPHFLDFAELTPISYNADRLSDLWQPLGFQDLLEAVWCRDLFAYYLRPQQAPTDNEALYPYSWEGGSGVFYLPDLVSAADTVHWVAALEYYEGAYTYLPFWGFLTSVSNILPENFFDGRFLCLAGGGVLPVHPEYIMFPSSLGGIQDFVFSASATYDGDPRHGAGFTSSEYWQLMSPDQQTVSGFRVTNARNSVAAFPGFGAQVLAGEYITVEYGEPSGGTPPVRFEPSAPSPPPEGAIPPLSEDLDLLEQLLFGVDIERFRLSTLGDLSSGGSPVTFLGEPLT